MTQQKYPLKSVGRLMTKQVPIAFPEEKILDIKNRLFEKLKTKEFETINYIYVTNQANQLVGVFSIKEIFRQPDETKVCEIMKKNFVVVRPRSHRQKAAALAVKHNLKAIPVIEKNGLFLGILPSDTILNILHEENIEDILYSAGITMTEVQENGSKLLIDATVLTHFRRRLPWLLVGLGGGILAAFVVQFFEESLKNNILLALFIPLVVYMADAVGTQTQTLYIRSMAIDSVLNLKKYIFREIKVGLALSVVLGLSITILSISYWKVPMVGFILGLSVFTTVLASMAIAIFLPWFFSKIKYDPAIASGPFATVIRDILSLLIYFLIAQIFFKIFI